jgi:hypothetical protein
MIILGHNPASVSTHPSPRSAVRASRPLACPCAAVVFLAVRTLLGSAPTRTCVRTAAANRNEPDLLKTEADSPEGFGAK